MTYEELCEAVETAKQKIGAEIAKVDVLNQKTLLDIDTGRSNRVTGEWVVRDRLAKREGLELALETLNKSILGI